MLPPRYSLVGGIRLPTVAVRSLLQDVKTRLTCSSIDDHLMAAALTAISLAANDCPRWWLLKLLLCSLVLFVATTKKWTTALAVPPHATNALEAYLSQRKGDWSTLPGITVA